MNYMSFSTKEFLQPMTYYVQADMVALPNIKTSTILSTTQDQFEAVKQYHPKGTLQFGFRAYTLDCSQGITASLGLPIVPQDPKHFPLGCCHCSA